MRLQVLSQRPPIVLAAAAACLSLAGCAAPPAATVHLHEFAFQPDALELQRATTVRFVNDDAVTHNVTVHGPDGLTALAQDLAPGAHVDFTFAQPGPYHVVCAYHANRYGMEMGAFVS